MLKISAYIQNLDNNMSKILCLSHKEDVDGLSSAALIKAAFKVSSVILVDYANFIKVLETVLNEMEDPQSAYNHIFLCDLGLSKKNETVFVNIIKKIMSYGCKVTYIDHHDLGVETKSQLKEIGVKLIHSIDECTSVQIYYKYKKKLKPHAAFLAAAGAITDYLETKPKASTIVSKYDRQFLMLEASALSYMISSGQHETEFLSAIIEKLSDMKYPHDIEEGFDRAKKYAQKVSNAVKSIEDRISIGNHLAYLESNVELSSSLIVNFVLGLSGKTVALVYRFKADINSYIISIRGSKECMVHLGRAVNAISSDLGGSGGGHDRACGAVIPKERMKKFIEKLDAVISNNKN